MFEHHGLSGVILSSGLKCNNSLVFDYITCVYIVEERMMALDFLNFETLYTFGLSTFFLNFNYLENIIVGFFDVFCVSTG